MCPSYLLSTAVLVTFLITETEHWTETAQDRTDLTLIYSFQGIQSLVVQKAWWMVWLYRWDLETLKSLAQIQAGL